MTHKEKYLIKVVDTFCTGVVHKKFNAALLEMLAYTDYEIEYCSQSKYGRGLGMVVSKDCAKRVVFNHLYVWNGEGRWDVLIRYIIGVFQNIRILVQSNSNQIVIFNFNNPFSLWFINVINKMMKRKVFVLCHGEMEHLIPGAGHGGLLFQLTGFTIRYFFMDQTRKPSINFIVLSESVLEHIRKVLPPNMAKKFKEVELPYVYEQIAHYDKRFDTSLCLGTVGTFNEYRGGTGLVELIEELKGEERVRFSITGKIDWGLEKLKTLHVSVPENEGKKMVSAEEFRKRISELDYILYFYPSNSYKLIASAAVMDAIELRKPIIGIRNDYFEHLFKYYGPFGYLVDDVKEMAKLIRKIVNEKNNLEFDFDGIQKASSPKVLSSQLVNIIESVINDN